jgi:hypothetical protein
MHNYVCITVNAVLCSPRLHDVTAVMTLERGSRDPAVCYVTLLVNPVVAEHLTSCC